MSDNEVQNTEKHLETASSSADESSASEAAKMSQVSEEPRRQRQVSHLSFCLSENRCFYEGGRREKNGCWPSFRILRFLAG